GTRSSGWNVEHFDDWDDPEGYSTEKGPYEYWGVNALGGSGGGPTAGTIQFESGPEDSGGGSKGATFTTITTSVKVQLKGLGYVGGSTGPGGSAGFTNPAAISFWFKPDAGLAGTTTLFDIGQTSERNHISLTYDGSARRLEFRVQDAALEDQREGIVHE